MTAPIVCTGRPVNDAGQPIGEPCRRVYHRRCSACTRTGHAAAIAEQARAAGWSVTGPPMCPRCRRPDPAIAQGLTPKEHT